MEKWEQDQKRGNQRIGRDLKHNREKMAKKYAEWKIRNVIEMRQNIIQKYEENMRQKMRTIKEKRHRREESETDR